MVAVFNHYGSVCWLQNNSLNNAGISTEFDILVGIYQGSLLGSVILQRSNDRCNERDQERSSMGINYVDD